ncbi:PAS domain S-box protein [Leptolyngbya sp. FACHB-261]|uniref:sensor histidine kinase n=1 Tax=Leptolyngbya sp. FACHB-261 TaxID=2692806 RepID=UPI001681D105|nr:PAS domain S-box protein [Leptolyngbya sp. FACHB-261]MBD2100038.1 PAS domain S-box protein [Leptolyngbya sp. FACHB-261]
MPTSQQIQAEIQARFGFVPPFFAPAQQHPQVLENLWQQTVSAYLDNPLPALFKEKLAAYLARYCATPYCLVCHSCTLSLLGMKAQEVLALLQSPGPTATDIQQFLEVLAGEMDALTDWPAPGSLLETSLLACSIFIFLERQETERCRGELHRLLGPLNYQHLITFIAYLKTCHLWVEAHPEVAYEADPRARNHLNALVQSESRLGNFFANYGERVRQEQQSKAELQAELTAHKQAEESLRQTHNELESRVRERTQELALLNEQLRAEIAERQRVQLSLQQREEHFRSLVHNIPGVIFRCAYDLAWTMEYVSDGIEELTGYPAADFIGNRERSFASIDHPEDLAMIAQVVQQGLDERQPWMLEYRIIRANGSVRWVYEKGQGIFNQDGSVCWIDGAVFDITERKQAEEEQRRQQELLQTIFEKIPVMVALFDERGRVKMTNPACETTLGWPAEEIQCRDLMVELYPNSQYRQSVLDCIRSAEGKWEDFRTRTRDGRILDTSWANVLLSDGTSIGIGQDITERKQAEAKLQQLYQRVQLLNTELEQQVQERTAQLQQSLEFEATLKRVTDKVRDGLDEGQILQTAVRELALALAVSCCNTALYDLDLATSTVYHEYALSGLPSAQGQVLQIVDFMEIYSQLLQGQCLQFCGIVAGSSRLHAAILACPIFDDQGILGDLWLFKPLNAVFTELEIRLIQQVANQCAIAIRQARLYQASQAQVAALEEINHLKDDFLSTVSHELRTPLSNMKMAIHMLRMFVSEERCERYLKILHDECARETELINDLLDLQRLEVGADCVHLETLQLQDWLPKIIEPFLLRVKDRQQTLDVELSADLPPLISNAAALERVLAELLNNACKYTASGGEIALKVGHIPERQAIIFVIHNQAEISATELTRIFEKFYRIPGADPWGQKGTGLGLALIQKLVERLGGEIGVESQAGQTTFTVELPQQGWV